jgi:hypothetical protein
MSLQFGFVILWQKAFGAKAALKTLVKLTPGVSVGVKSLQTYNVVDEITTIKSFIAEVP